MISSRAQALQASLTRRLLLNTVFALPVGRVVIDESIRPYNSSARLVQWLVNAAPRLPVYLPGRDLDFARFADTSIRKAEGTTFMYDPPLKRHEISERYPVRG